MKKIISTILFFSLHLVTNAQPSPPEPDPRWGAKGTRTVTKITDPNNFEQTTTIEYKDGDGRVREKVTWKKTIDGKYTRIDEIFTQSGRPMCKVTDKFNSSLQSLSREGIGYRKDGSEYKPETGWLSLPFEEGLRNEIKSIEEGKPVSFAPSQGPCKPGMDCQTRLRLIFGYSYLSPFDDNEEGFPVGFHGSGIYNINSHIGLGVDASVHTTKIYDENLTRSFVFATGKYTFGDVNKCGRSLVPDLHVLVGLVGEKYGKSKGSGFAFGVGGGVDIRISKHLAIGSQVDLIYAKFQENEAYLKHLRGTVGLVYW